MTEDSPSIEPRRPMVTRREAAALVNQHYFPVSPRTLERAPLTWRFIAGRVMVEKAELFRWAEAKVAAAAPIRGGHRKQPPAMKEAA